MFLNGGPYGDSCPFPQPFFTCLSNSSRKVLLIKTSHPSLEGSREGASLFPKTGPLWKETPISRALISISFGVSSKGALPPGPLYRAPTERDAPLPKPSFIHLSKSLVNEPPFQVPQQSP